MVQVRTIALLTFSVGCIAANLWFARYGSWAGYGFVILATVILLAILLFLVHRQGKRLNRLEAEHHQVFQSLGHLQVQRSQMDLLLRLMHRFVQARSLKEVVEGLLQETAPFFGATKVEVVSLNNEAPVFRATLTPGGQVNLETENPPQLDGQEKAALAREGPSVGEHQILLPLRTEGKPVALLRLERKTHPFSDDEIHLLTLMADQAALAFDRAKLLAFLERLAVTDPLTDIANRRQLEFRLPEEIERARRYRYPLTALMIDLDHFKRLNDTYGHRVGDRGLQHVVSILRRNLRRTDFLARYGGEEFVVLAPHTSAENALILGERLRRSIAESPLKVEGLPLLPMTVSIGAAVFPDHARNERELLEAADKALYEAKRAGRNCVRLYRPGSKISA